MEDILETSKVWMKDDFSPMGIFSSMEIIIDTEHKISLIGEIEERIEQVYTHMETLRAMIPEVKKLENFLQFVERTEIVID